MYKIGEYVICGNNGICQVEGVTTLNLEGVDNTKEYYLMKPVFSNGSTVYKPTDLDDGTIRPALNKSEAEALIADIPSIHTVNIIDEKALEKTYKELMRSFDPKAMVQLIKTIYLRKEKRLLKGFKITALDSRYFKQAEDFLYGELAVALALPRNEVKEYISQKIEGTY